MSVYVERLIRAPIESVWNKSQQPDQHQRWDLRFTRIEYLPWSFDRLVLLDVRPGEIPEHVLPVGQERRE